MKRNFHAHRQQESDRTEIACEADSHHIAFLPQSRCASRGQLQIKSGLSLGLIYRYWNNQTTQATFEALEKIAKALGVRPLELLTDEEGGQKKKAKSVA